MESKSKSTMRIGIISDTHGLMRQEALEALQGSDMILHAGDVGSQDVLDALEDIAPVHAVRGNMDGGDWARLLPKTQWVEISEITIYLLHDLEKLDLIPQAAGISMVIYGHTHQPKEELRNGVTYLNPGSAGPRRFSKPVSLTILQVEGRNVNARMISLDS